MKRTTRTIMVAVGALALAFTLGACKKKAPDKSAGDDKSMDAPAAMNGMEMDKPATMDGMDAAKKFEITLKADTGLAHCDKVITAHICYWKKKWAQVMAPLERRKREHDLYAASVKQQLRSGNADWKKKKDAECKKKLETLEQVAGFKGCVPK